MSIVANIAQRFGFIPKVEATRQARRAYNVGRRMVSRSYAAAQSNRLTGDMSSITVTPDQDIRNALVTVRARARDLVKNNPHGKRFIRLLRMNIPGPHGFKLQSNVTEMDLRDPRNPRRVPDKTANMIIEEAWAEWCKPANCSVTGNQSFRAIQHLAVTHLGRDGECIIREVRNRSPFRYQLQILEPDMLDETYNNKMDNGNVVRMGIELDQWRRPVAYYFLKNDPAREIYGWSYRNQQRERIPADQIIHCYDQESAFQTRGMSWLTASLMKLHMLGEYEFAAVTKARVGANNLGFFEPDRELAASFDGGDSKDADGNIIVDADPLGITELPPGMKFNSWNPDYPSQQYEMFTKSIQRSVASGLDVSYMSLTSDLNDTTYGSGRIGIIDERESYKERQQWLIETVLNRIYGNWLEMAIMSDRIRLPIEKFEKFNKPSFVGRRWPWFDPLKDAQAMELLLKLRLITRTQIAGEMGEDFQEILRDTLAEMELAEEIGVSIPEAGATATTKPGEKGMMDEENDMDDPEMKEMEKIKRAAEVILKKRNGHLHATQ